jgi:hypothetical protein
MKMVKSLLLGSAASLAAVTAGQAADLPVKAKPVEYVKVCSLYGAGFYYMPGTDLCLKIGGWVRAEATYSSNQTGSLAWGPFNANLQQRSSNNLAFRARGYITADAREQTAYGTARGYIAVGVNTNDVGLAAGESANNSFNANRAFVQFAGFTAGIATSFFDFYSAPAALYRAGFIPNEDTGDGGWWVWAYTAQLGNGVSATVSAEARRMSQLVDQTAVGTVFGGTLGAGGGAGTNYGGQQAPDVVGNIRVDQAWGSAQVMGAWHQIQPLYYGSSNVPILGGPSQANGWVVGAGLRLNTPFITQGDYFQGEVNYTQGALRYLNHGADTNYNALNGNQETFGVQSDCVYGGNLADGNATNCQLTSAWSFNASFEHYWTPQLHQSLAGGYMAVKYGNAANAMLCAGGGHDNGTGVGSGAMAAPGCNMNWNAWGVGSRLQYDVTKTFYVGVEALYSQLDGATTANPNLFGTGFSIASPNNPVLTNQHINNWAFTARMHKDFLP